MGQLRVAGRPADAPTHRVSEPGHHVHRLPGEPLLVGEHGEYLQDEEEEERHGSCRRLCSTAGPLHHLAEDDLHQTVV